jgi:hypothetical protein
MSFLVSFAVFCKGQGSITTPGRWSFYFARDVVPVTHNSAKDSLVSATDRSLLLVDCFERVEVFVNAVAPFLAYGWRSFEILRALGVAEFRLQAQKP